MSIAERRPPTVAALAAAALVVAAVPARAAPDAPLGGTESVSAETPRPAGAGPGGGSADTSLAVDRSRGFPAVRASALAGTPVGELRVDDGRLRGTVGGDTLELRPGSPFLRHGSAVYQMANVPYVEDGRTWVPAELLTRWLPEATGADPRRVEDGRISRIAPFRDDPFRVVIDPGHGGRDPGAIGPRGVREKDVTLAVARELKEALEDEPRVKPLLTRDRDTLVALQDRSRFAVEHGGDLFLSLHANASESRHARGFETYFLSPARTEEAREVAMRENAAVKYERGSDAPKMSDLQFILADLDQDINVRESSRLAGYTQNALRPVHGGPDRGVKQAGFLVLVGASGSMPSVLVEMGFLTNPNESRVLESEQGQEKIAESIADAVVRYFEQYRRRIAGKGTSR